MSVPLRRFNEDLARLRGELDELREGIVEEIQEKEGELRGLNATLEQVDRMIQRTPEEVLLDA